MSGFEIVGVVLAILPFFISAAEHYKEGLGFVRRAVKKDLVLSQYRAELTQQKTLLTLYLKGVLGRTSLSANVQSQLVDDPTSDAWHRLEIIKEISHELGDAYEPFMGVMTRVSSALLKQLQPEEGDQISPDELVKQLEDLYIDCKQAESGSQKTKSKLWDRIKFSWKHPERNMMLAEFKGCNELLEKLSTAAERAKPYQRRQEIRRAHAAYGFRDEAQRLFQILCKACKCQCSVPCEVSLQMQRCADQYEDDRDSCFQLLLFPSGDTSCQMSARISKPMDAKPAKKKVRIQAPDPMVSSLSSALTSNNMSILGDICEEIRKAHESKLSLNIFVNNKEEVWAVQNVPRPRQQRNSHHLLSLEEVMSKLKPFDHKRWLHREKAILAVVLAYSLLQLHNSPWLQMNWSTKTIAFVDDTMTSVAQRSPDFHFRLRRPYTRSVLKLVPLVPAPDSSGMPKRMNRRNAHIHALGIVLLELYLNRSIEDDVMAEGGFDYRGVAQDLLEDHADDITMAPEYLKAVRFCLSPHPDPFSGSYSFEDSGFREIFYSEVIFMLEENLMSRFEIGEKIWKEDD